MKSKKHLIILIVIIWIFNFVGCVNDNTDKINQNNEVYLRFSTSRLDLANTKIRTLIDMFEEEYPHIKVSIEGLAEPDVITKNRAVTGGLTDISIIPSETSSSIYSEYFLPLDDLEFTKENLFGYEDLVGNDGKLYGLNSGVSYNGIIYNKKVFEKAKIEHLPKTNEEFFEVCKMIKNYNITPIAIVAKENKAINWIGNDLIHASIVSDDLNYANNLLDRELFSYDGGFLESAIFLNELYKNDYAKNDFILSWEEIKVKQANSEIGMIFAGTWYISQLEDKGLSRSDIGFMPIPESKSINKTGDRIYGISKNTKYPDEAKLLLKWLWTDGRYAKVLGLISPNNETNQMESEISEMNLPICILKRKSNKYNRIFKIMGVDLNDILLDYVMSEDKTNTINKYNLMWKRAKEDLTVD